MSVLLDNRNKPVYIVGICQSIFAFYPRQLRILILFWTAVVGTLYYFFLSAPVFATEQTTHINIPLYDSIPYAISALVMIFYPLSGFIADVCCGRLKTIVTSLCLLLTGLTYLSVLFGDCNSGIKH